MYSLNNLLREAENELVDVVNPFAELKRAWAKYTATVSMFLFSAIWDHHDHVDCCVPQGWRV